MSLRAAPRGRDPAAHRPMGCRPRRMPSATGARTPPAGARAPSGTCVARRLSSNSSLGMPAQFECLRESRANATPSLGESAAASDSLLLRFRRDAKTKPLVRRGCPWKHEGSCMVGATGFEPATSCSRSRRATGLRYAPPNGVEPLQRLVYAPVGIRTPNLLIRSQMLYPVELRALTNVASRSPGDRMQT